MLRSSQVQILIDGAALGNATLGGSRPDVATALNNAAYTNSGWTFTYAASSFSVGAHTVTVVATDSSESVHDTGGRVRHCAVITVRTRLTDGQFCR